jgi:hypothetical protein
MLKKFKRKLLVGEDLSVVPVHVQLVTMENVRRLIDVLDGQSDRGHDTSADFTLRSSRSHGEKGGKVNISSGKKGKHFFLLDLINEHL